MKKILLFALMAIISTVAFAQDKKIKQASDLVAEGVKLYDDGNYKEAVKKYDASIKLFDKFPTAYYEKALALYAMDNIKEAKKVLLQSIEKCEEDENIALNYKFLGDINDIEGETRKAIDYYNKAIDLVADYNLNQLQTIGYNMGVAYERLAAVETDSAATHLDMASDCFIHSLICNPQHAGSYYGLYDAIINPLLPISERSFYHAFCVIGWYAFFGGDHSKIGILANIPDTWATFSLTEEELSNFGPMNQLIYKSAHELADQKPSEYGRLYDMLMYIIPKVTENITDEPIPLQLSKNDIASTVFWPLYAKMVRESVLETFCHAVATRVEKDYATNAEWLTNNEEAQQKLIDFLNEGRYFDNSLLMEQMYGKKPSVTAVTSAEDAHARNEEALLAFKYYLSHYLGNEDLQQTAQFIMSWALASPDVVIPIGQAESKWLSKETAPYFVAYLAYCSYIELESASKDLTLQQYMEAVSNMLDCYEQNKDKIGKNDELERLSNLDESSFAKEMKANYEVFKATEQE